MIKINAEIPPIFAAILEILIVLAPAIMLGYGLAMLIIFFRKRYLSQRIRRMEAKLAECQKQKITLPLIKPGQKPAVRKTVVVEEQSVDKLDDLKLIAGIGPKIEELLRKKGIHSYKGLSETSPIFLVAILKNAGPRFQIQDPSHWPEQAAFAAAEKWAELEKFKAELAMGKKIKG